MVSTPYFLFRRTLALDALLVTGACMIPAVSHLFAWPLYQLNPMLMLLLVGLGFTAQDKQRFRLLNGLLLAVLLPLVSSLLVGMPSASKALCMMAEFATVVVMMNMLPAAHASFQMLGRTLVVLLAAKGVFYLLKLLVMGSEMLVSTPMMLQLVTLVLASLLYMLIAKK